MHRKLRFLVYGVAGAAILIAAIGAPAAWATPGQNVAAQTVPTRTPIVAPVEPTVPPPADTPAPTSAPPPTAQPGVTPAAPASGGEAGSGATCASTAALTLVADRAAVWPGATVTFTATLTNTGPQPLLQVVLEDVLASGLEPVSVISGESQWQGRTLRLALPSLDPGASLTAVYAARVAQERPGAAIVAQANATSAGCPRKTAAVTLGFPPSELPATGGSLK